MYAQFNPAVLGSIGDRVFLDTNNDGRWQAGIEPGVANIQVNLFDAQWQLIGTTWTAGDGTYHFTSLAPATYTVQFILTSAYKFTTTDSGGDDTIDSDANSATGTSKRGMVRHTTKKSVDESPLAIWTILANAARLDNPQFSLDTVLRQSTDQRLARVEQVPIACLGRQAKDGNAGIIRRWK